LEDFSAVIAIVPTTFLTTVWANRTFPVKTRNDGKMKNHKKKILKTE